MPMKTSIIDGIPVFEALVGDENDGMVRISLVDLPAVMSDWQRFAGQQPQTFAIQSEEQRLIRGVIMRADFPIYRRDDRGEYYLIFRADTIRQMAEKYLAESRQNKVDTMHNTDEVEDVQMVQFFIKDTARGVNPDGFDDIADGSLFAEFHCTNDEVWEQVKAGTFRGFSLEGFFSFQPDTDQPGIDDIVDGLAGQFAAELKTDRANTMSKIAKTLERLRELLEADAAARVTMGRVTTDRGVLAWPGEEDLKAGDAVEIITDEEGNTAPAEDGEYRTEDGKTIIVENGQVAEIRDPEAEVAPQGDEPQEAAEEEAPEAAEPEAPAAEDEPDYKALYEQALERISELEAAIAEANTQQEAAVAASAVLESELEAVRSEVATLRATPTAKPAHDEVKAAAEAVKTGDKRIDTLNRLMAAK